MQARLIIIHSKPYTHITLGEKTLIGRHPSCTLQFKDSKMSSQHCLIEKKYDKYYIKDLKSTNGTYVNGERIEYKELEDGDVIKCGEKKFYFQYSKDNSFDLENNINFLKAENEEDPLKIKVEDKENKIGEYLILEKIGQGGIGEVYKAIHSTKKNIVAIKVLSPQAQQKETLIKRFIREAEACIKLNHPKIIKVYEVGEYNNRPYFVMEYIQGKSLDKYIKEKGALGVISTLKIGGHIAHALAYAHSHNIIHRDLKPGNILVEDKTYSVKLIDLGLAKMLDESRITLTNHIVGTPRYMAPEQMKSSKDIDVRADIYSLGATLYHIITGFPPYSEIITTNKSALLRYMYKNNPIPIKEIRKDVPDEVVNLINKAMHKDKEKRFQNAQELYKSIYKLVNKLQKKLNK